MNFNQSPGGPDPARQGSARPTDFREGDRVFVSCSNSPTHPRTRQVGDLFQPVTSAEPPAAAITDQLITPVKPAPQSWYASSVRRCAGRGAGLVIGTPGAVIALGASAALVLVMAGTTMFTASSSTESAGAGLTPAPLPAPAIPAISDEQVSDAHVNAMSPIDAPAGFARQQTPATAYSPDPPAASVQQQPSVSAHHAGPAPAAPPPAPDHRPALPPPPPPSAPPSTVTTEDAGYWTTTTDSHAEKAESPATETDGPRGKIHYHGARPSKVDRQGQPGAQQERYRSTGRTEQSTVSEQGKQDRRAVRPDVKAPPRPSPNGRP